MQKRKHWWVPLSTSRKVPSRSRCPFTTDIDGNFAMPLTIVLISFIRATYAYGDHGQTSTLLTPWKTRRTTICCLLLSIFVFTSDNTMEVCHTNVKTTSDCLQLWVVRSFLPIDTRLQEYFSPCLLGPNQVIPFILNHKRQVPVRGHCDLSILCLF